MLRTQRKKKKTAQSGTGFVKKDPATGTIVNVTGPQRSSNVLLPDPSAQVGVREPSGTTIEPTDSAELQAVLDRLEQTGNSISASLASINADLLEMIATAKGLR